MREGRSWVLTLVIWSLVRAMPIMTLFLHARLANIARALEQRTMGLCRGFCAKAAAKADVGVVFAMGRSRKRWISSSKSGCCCFFFFLVQRETEGKVC